MKDFKYNEPKGRIFERAQNLRDVVVLGRDADGKPVGWSSQDERATTELLNEHSLATAETVG